ncbi:ABC transporter permease [Prosthecobacter vanneervenii]|uniref:NitT/TauT family transport system permease protein n=1 Tax=Prosthecobacter vanneervenii TaxID=48466 RepID=A0A7W7YCW3_9BACT|nr:ABC transporter permease [Prosthecobacter vanneervenii]MBB5033774.1 NitT/TauT family transport system permease protein [Prosthecobacter vanneervenii]
MKRALSSVAFFAVVVALWEAASRAGWWSPVLVPSPLAIGKYLATTVADGTLWSAGVVTMTRLGIGYIIGLLLGIPLGLLTARFRFASDTLGVLALGLQTLPSVCWVPLSLLWFGQTESAMLFIVIMGTLWAVQLATDHGIRQIPPIYRRAATTMGSSGFHLLWHVLLPASLPHLVSGMKQGWAFAWRSLMAAEIYVTVLTGFGLGHLLHYGRELQAMDQVAAIMLVIIVVGFVADKALFSPWERFLRKRWGLA